MIVLPLFMGIGVYMSANTAPLSFTDACHRPNCYQAKQGNNKVNVSLMIPLIYVIFIFCIHFKIIFFSRKCVKKEIIDTEDVENVESSQTQNVIKETTTEGIAEDKTGGNNKASDYLVKY